MRVGIAVLLTAMICASSAAGQTTWFKGNLHVHTDRSDGVTPPPEVVSWYRDRGYDFLSITDHNLQSVTSELLEAVDLGGLLVLRGVEVTDRVGGRPVHLNGIGVHEVVLPQGGEDVPTVIDQNVDAVERAGGLAILNHPNGLLRAAISAEEVSSSRVEFFEVCCSDYLGGSGHPSTDEIWDEVLSSGRRLWGVAADDAHDFGPESRDPGSSWVMVEARELSGSAILEALRSGAFYSTTGVLLDEVERGPERLCVRIGDYEAYGFRTEYIGEEGRVLSTSERGESCQELSRGEVYVRARVLRSDGARAWVQPLFRVGGI
jgi:hypothetical protein